MLTSVPTQNDDTTISVTQARNNFFDIAMEAYMENKEFVVKKNDIPIIRITRYTEKCDDDRVKKQKRLLAKIQKHLQSMPSSTDSTNFICASRQKRT